MGAAMEQTSLPLTMARMDAPSIVSTSAVTACQSYREGVRLAWKLSRVKGANAKKLQTLLAQEIGAYASHISDWFNQDDKPSRRSLPAHLIPAFEAYVGNTLVSQWLAAQSKLTVLEEMQAERMAA